MTWCEAYRFFFVVESIGLGDRDSFSVALFDCVYIPRAAATIIAIERWWNIVRVLFAANRVVCICDGLNLHILRYIIPWSDVNKAIVETGVGHWYKITFVNKRLRGL